MSTLAEWTGTRWTESEKPPYRDFWYEPCSPGEGCFERGTGIPQPSRKSIRPNDEPQLDWIQPAYYDGYSGHAGIALLGLDYIWLEYYFDFIESDGSYTRKAAAYSPDVIYQTALHEALHALYAAEHTPAGIMCTYELYECPAVDKHTWGGFIWTLTMRPLDAEVYKLYSNPLLTHGMSKELVEQIVQAPGQ